MKKISNKKDAAAAEKALLEVTSLPTAAAHEDAVIKYVADWAGSRSARLILERDRCGNLVLTRKDFKKACRGKAPLYITAHLDHPAFIVRSVKSSGDAELEFRGGVHDAYFKGAVIEIFDAELARSFTARIIALDAKAKPFKTVHARLSRPADAALIKAGCLGRWKFPRSSVRGGLAYTNGCDDLACVAAALLAFDKISSDKKLAHVAVLFTRAEEIGFVGAIGAARGGTVPKNARLVCLECSRSFPHDSPIGAGPIVRVGDRMSVFTPELTNIVSNIAAGYQKENPAFKFQRKLMPGGVCEASAFSFYGLRSTCVCLPLGNYHNMQDPDAALAGKKGKVGQEFIAVADFLGMIELLGAVARGLDAPGEGMRGRMEKIWAQHGALLSRDEK
ncbi:MAG TPA: hypothetical protein DCZ92_00570 [Elusimicrobia bacterium]|nr:MAG: hypothetical protein A2016_09875 [Elusimicrobia bacterium GWF2_62_30]HBA59319.1 hypothetical protein [Elusimicrobiota bacterium]